MPENFRRGEELKPMQYYSLQLEDIGEPVEDVIGTLQAKIEQNLKVAAVSAAEFFDKAVYDAIVQEAKKAGVTDLVIFDRDFVVEAIKRNIVHGRWVRAAGKSNIWYCSVCGDKINYKQNRRTYNIPKVPVEQKNKFCRNCGAKMDAKEVEADG